MVAEVCYHNPMQIFPINQTQFNAQYNKKQQMLTPKNTGYIATSGLGVAIISGLSKNKTIRKMHKPASYIAAIATALHIGLIESFNFRHRKM